MNADELDRLRERAIRLYQDIRSAKGKGSDIELPIVRGDGSLGVARYADVRSGDDWEDVIASLIHCVGAQKDHVKDRARRKGVNPADVERRIADCMELCVCIDLDNRAKHVRLRLMNGKLGRTGLEPRLGPVKEVFPMYSANDPQVREHGLLMTQPGATVDSVVDLKKFRFKYPRLDLVQITAPVLDAQGNVLGDACDIVKKAMDQWDNIRSDLGLQGD